MDFNECTQNLKYIKEVMNLFERIDEKAQQLNEEKDNRIYELDQKNFKKLWNIQKKRLRKKLVWDHYLHSDYLPTKLKSFFTKVEPKMSELEKLDNFFSSLNDENFVVDLNTPLKFKNEKLITPTSYAKTFDEIMAWTIENIERYYSAAHAYHLDKKHLPLLKQIKADAEKENYDSVIIDFKERFDHFVREQFESFAQKFEEERLNTSLFNVRNYLPDYLMQNLDLTRPQLIKNQIEKHRVIYHLCLEVYSKQLAKVNTLTISNLSQALRMSIDPLTLIDSIDPRTMIFEEKNVLKELNVLFPIYTDTHEALEKICIEMSERNLIPKNIQDDLRNHDGHFNKFSQFFTKVVDRHELHKKLNIELPEKTEVAPGKKQKVKI